MAEHVHTYPVDASLTPEEAWRELCLMGVRATNTGSETWANIVCGGEECEGIADGRSFDCRCVCLVNHPDDGFPCEEAQGVDENGLCWACAEWWSARD